MHFRPKYFFNRLTWLALAMGQTWSVEVQIVGDQYNTVAAYFRTIVISGAYLFFKHNFCVKPYVPREPRRDPSNRRLNEHGIYISSLNADML